MTSVNFNPFSIALNCLGLDQDQDGHIVGPDLGPNCEQRLSAKDKSRHFSKERVNHFLKIANYYFSQLLMMWSTCS